MSGWRIGWAVSAALLFVAALACDATSGPAADASPSPTAAGETATPKPDFDSGVILEEFPPGAPRNEVRLQNADDNRFMARASLKTHKVQGDDVRPYNLALVQAQCTDCQTIAVAVQVVFYQRGAPSVQPENIAIASNVGCTRCVTIAMAVQYVIPVDDLKADVPDEVKNLVKDIDKELRYFSTIKSISELNSDEAAARLQQVLDQYGDLQQYLNKIITKRTQNNEPDPQQSSSPSPAGATTAPSASPAEPTASPATSPVPAPSATP
jgi:hypothetical protein